jgi:1-acyl-sn-glycerol-3-phosphate acyltransferase
MTVAPAASPPAEGPPRRGTPFSRAFARGLMRLAGWRVEGSLPDCPRFVLIVAPHTSNWDFLVGIMAMFATGLRLSWLGKHTIFRLPFTPVLRWLGGEPVDRAAAQGTVEAAIQRFGSRPRWVLGLAPEGTRRRGKGWKMGFHRIAVGAGVPILPVWIDYRRRVLGLGTLFTPGADAASDLARLGTVYRKEMARYPERFTETALPLAPTDDQPAAPSN